MNITEFIISQREHAFLIGDHGAYRSQLARQLRTLRRSLGRSTPKNAKYANRPITAEDIGQNQNFAHIPILTAERAWAHAMYMKSSHAEDATAQKIAGSRRTHIVSRLTKAVKHAQHLADSLEQSAAKVSKIDWLEAKAYTAYLQGAAHLEKHSGSPKLSDKNAQREKWSECLENLSIARIIYAALLKKTKKESFKEILSTSIDSAMRFASYQSQIPRTIPVTEVARRCFPEDEISLVKEIEVIDPLAFKSGSAGGEVGASDLPTTITWRGRRANLVDASIGQALLTISSAEEQLKAFLSSEGGSAAPKSRAVAYDDVLTASQEAVDATRHAIDDHEKEQIPESDSRMQDLRITSLAVNYDLIGWRIGRNRILIGARDGLALDDKEQDGASKHQEGRGRKLARLRERVVLYDAILQSIDSIKELRGAVRDETFVGELDAKKSYFQALKCLDIAYSHALLSNYENTLALLIRAASLSSKSVKSASSSDTKTDTSPLKIDVDAEAAQKLHDYLQTSIYQYTALVSLNSAAQSGKDDSKNKTLQTPIIHRLTEYPSGKLDLTNLVTYPPKVQPVPVKPLFFDLAWNYIEYPGHTSKTAASAAKSSGSKAESETAQEDKPTKKGWFGFGGR